MEAEAMSCFDADLDVDRKLSMGSSTHRKEETLLHIANASKGNLVNHPAEDSDITHKSHNLNGDLLKRWLCQYTHFEVPQFHGLNFEEEKASCLSYSNSHTTCKTGVHPEQGCNEGHHVKLECLRIFHRGRVEQK